MLKDVVPEWLIPFVGGGWYFLIACVWMLLLSGVFSYCAVRIFTKRGLTPTTGLAIGFGYGLFAIAAWLTLFWLGAYPNLVWIFFFVFSAPIDTVQEEIVLISLNLTAAPAIGWFVGFFGKRMMGNRVERS